MKIVFMGTPDFAVASLKNILQSNHEIVGVITATDKPAGRGQKVRYSAVKEFALENELNLLQPPNLKDESFVNELKNLEADLFVVVAFRMLPDVVWTMPKEGTINLHASLLPQYRGAAPINWAIINGEQQSGATTFFIEKKIDTGNIIDQITVDITEEMNAGELHDELMVKGADLLLKTIDAIAKGNVVAKPQKSIEVKELRKAYKIYKDTCEIDWSKEAIEIHNLIRGLSPYPAAFSEFELNGKRIKFKIFKAMIVADTNVAQGEIFTDYKSVFQIGTSEGVVQILELQMAGKKRMDIKSFLNGNKQSKFAL